MLPLVTLKYFFRKIVDNVEQSCYSDDVPMMERKELREMTVDVLRIKGERIAKGITQEEMANALGITRTAYTKRETGNTPITADELAIIAAKLGVGKDGIGIFFSTNVPKLERK